MMDLGEMEKDVFLHIACFLKDKNKNYIIAMVDGCGFSSIINIKKACGEMSHNNCKGSNSCHAWHNARYG